VVSEERQSAGTAANAAAAAPKKTTKKSSRPSSRMTSPSPSAPEPPEGVQSDGVSDGVNQEVIKVDPLPLPLPLPPPSTRDDISTTASCQSNKQLDSLHGYSVNP